jgi:hypothetical protein
VEVACIVLLNLSSDLWSVLSRCDIDIHSANSDDGGVDCEDIRDGNLGSF